MAHRPKAVLDTQIVLRGLIRLRPLSAVVQVFERALQGRFAAVTSHLLLAEVRGALRAMGAVVRLSDSEIVDAVDRFARRVEVVPGHVAHLRQIVPKDLDDNPLFEAALEADAGYVVSEDRAVLDVKSLVLKGFRPIQVMAPGPFLRLLKTAG